MSRAQAPRALVALCIWSVATGCMFIVDGDLGTIHCADEGAFGPPACPEGNACVDGLCAPRDPSASHLGDPCDVDEDCAAEDFCLYPSLFGGTGLPSCSRKCCSSSDCDRSAETHDAGPFVCWVPAPGGGSFCRDASAVERPGPGAGKAGDPCSSAKDCRSSLCVEKACTDVCCSDASCAAGGARCQMLDGVASSGASWSCAPVPAAKQGFLEPCTTDAECISGLCVVIADKLLCSQPCCDSTSCGTYKAGTVAGQLACVDVPRHGSLVRACARVLPASASLATGAPCTGDAECRGGACIQPEVGAGGSRQERICSDVCCVDEDCGDKSTLACRPFQIGLHVGLAMRAQVTEDPGGSRGALPRG